MMGTIEMFYIIILSLKVVTLAACATPQFDAEGSCTPHSSDAMQILYSWLLPAPIVQLPETCDYKSSASLVDCGLKI